LRNVRAGSRRHQASYQDWKSYPKVKGLKLVWLGTSVEDARVLSRLDELRRVPAVVRLLGVIGTKFVQSFAERSICLYEDDLLNAGSASPGLWR
jgi:hypothetical protein